MAADGPTGAGWWSEAKWWGRGGLPGGMVLLVGKGWLEGWLLFGVVVMGRRWWLVGWVLLRVVLPLPPPLSESPERRRGEREGDSMEEEEEGT